MFTSRSRECTVGSAFVYAYPLCAGFLHRFCFDVHYYKVVDSEFASQFWDGQNNITHFYGVSRSLQVFQLHIDHLSESHLPSEVRTAFKLISLVDFGCKRYVVHKLINF